MTHSVWSCFRHLSYMICILFFLNFSLSLSRVIYCILNSVLTHRILLSRNRCDLVFDIFIPQWHTKQIVSHRRAIFSNSIILIISHTFRFPLFVIAYLWRNNASRVLFKVSWKIARRTNCKKRKRLRKSIEHQRSNFKINNISLIICKSLHVKYYVMHMEL